MCNISTAKVKKFHDLPYIVFISAKFGGGGEIISLIPTLLKVKINSLAAVNPTHSKI